MRKTRLKIAVGLVIGSIASTTGAAVAEYQRRPNSDAGAEAPGKVTLLRVPNRGIQPQVAVDANATVHLIYFHGDAGAGDIYYCQADDGRKFTQPLRVNSEPGSAIAIGNIRGAHLALGKKGRVHVAWNGSDKAKPRGPENALPMMYTRMNDQSTAFEPERNVIHQAIGLDGGGSVAADDRGNVYVAWHASEP